MTRVIEIQTLESCLDSSSVCRITLDQELSEPLMHRLATEGDLQYFPHFPRPYFRIDRARKWVLQGVLGTYDIRVTFLPAAGADAVDELCTLIDPDGSPGTGGGER